MARLLVLNQASIPNDEALDVHHAILGLFLAASFPKVAELQPVVFDIVCAPFAVVSQQRVALAAVSTTATG